jgi:hypothetical protein
MMGHRSKRFKLFTETNLEALVPAGNFYRRLEGCLDISFVRELVRDRYEEGGRPSVDPVVFFKLHLIAFFDSKTPTKSGLPFRLRIRRRRKVFFRPKEAAA